MRYSRQTQVRKLLLQCLNERLPNLVLQIILLILIPLLHRGITTNGRDIDHAIPELHERPSLDRDVEVRDIVEHEPNQLLVAVFSNPLDEAVACQWDTHAVGCEAVLGEAEVKHCGDGDGLRAELFLLFCQVGAADEADGYFVAELGEELEHFGGSGLGDVRCVQLSCC